MVSNCNPVHPKYMYLDRLDRANSVNPDQTAPQLLVIPFTAFDMYIYYPCSECRSDDQSGGSGYYIKL